MSQVLFGNQLIPKFDPFQDENAFKYIAESRRLSIGMKVKVPHGTGTIVGFEYRGNTTTVVTGNYNPRNCLRVAIQLGEDNTWCFSSKEEHYFCYPNEVTAL